MEISAVEPRQGSVVMRFDLPAERLKMKGQSVRITHFDGTFDDYQVTDVAMPDESGAVVLTLSA